MEEQTEVQCPICNLSFRDKRGLTSHARNIHALERDEVFKKIAQKEQEKMEWKLIGGITAVLLAILSFGKLK